jgi:enoyl-[acyl-carrier-protein] reductase (NADH)
MPCSATVAALGAGRRWDRARARAASTRGLRTTTASATCCARVTPEHVGNAVVFLASNLTPTTGATIPVDGGVAEAFPR